MAGTKSVRLMILGDNKDAQAKIDEVNARADELAAEHPELKMGIDSAAAAEHLRILREDLRKTDREAKNVRDTFAEVDFAKMGSGGAWFAGIAAAAGPVPVLLGGVSAGLVGVAAAATPAVAGLGLFGAVAKTAFTEVEKADKANKHLTGGLGELQRGLNAAKSSWHGFVSKESSGVASVMGHAFELLPHALKDLQPLLPPTEKALNSIVSDVGHGLNSSGFKSFIRDLSAFAGPSLSVLASILGHLGDMAAKVVRDFLPFGTIVLRDINRLLARADAGTNSAIMKFFGWVSSHGSQVVSTVEDLGRAVRNVGAAFLTMGSADIGIFQAVSHFIEIISSNPIGADVLVGLLVLTKVGAAIGPLMKLVVAFKDLQEAIGIAKLASIAFMGVGIIGAIAAIITVIVLLVEHWRTVARVAADAWSWITHAAWQAYTEVVHFFWAMYHDVLSAVDNIIGWIAGHWRGLEWILAGPIGVAAGWIVGHWNHIIDGADYMWHRVINFFHAIPSGIRRALGGLSHLLWNAGYWVLHGFLAGMGHMWHRITGFIGGIAGYIAAHKGPIEVDAKLLTPHGKAIMGSLVHGLQAGMPWLTAQLSRTTNVIANTKTPAVLAASGNHGPITAEWVGGEEADSEFISFLKRNIRIRGGDPGVLGR